MNDTTAVSRHIASREITDLSSLGLADAAAAVRNGDITSEAYTAALLQRARELAELNAFITIDETAVLEAARDADKARAAGSATRVATARPAIPRGTIRRRARSRCRTAGRTCSRASSAIRRTAARSTSARARS